MELTTMIEIALLATAVAGFPLLAILELQGGRRSRHRRQRTGDKLG